jgi:hypothetical protein
VRAVICWASAPFPHLFDDVLISCFSFFSLIRFIFDEIEEKMKVKVSPDGKLADKLPVKRPRKKAKDKPKRPLSAYNFFFKDERETILRLVREEEPVKADGGDGEDSINGDVLCHLNRKGGKLPVKAEGGDDEDSVSDKVLSRLKKEGGKVSFEEMGKLIGQRWKKIDPDRLAQFSALASEDSVRYKKEMDAYNDRQDAKMRTEGYPTIGRNVSEEGPFRSGFQDAPGGTMTSAFSQTISSQVYHPYGMKIGVQSNYPYAGQQSVYHPHYAAYGMGPPPQDASGGMQGGHYGRTVQPQPGGMYGNYGYG